MTPASFRRIALSLEGATEGAHGGHSDFRAGGKVFASLGYPGKEWGMVKLAPDQQKMLVAAEPGIFVAVKGTWGQRGATSVRLAAAGGIERGPVERHAIPVHLRHRRFSPDLVTLLPCDSARAAHAHLFDQEIAQQRDSPRPFRARGRDDADFCAANRIVG